jgi:hypothetical protein
MALRLALHAMGSLTTAIGPCTVIVSVASTRTGSFVELLGICVDIVVNSMTLPLREHVLFVRCNTTVGKLGVDSYLDWPQRQSNLATN